jgi:hypothetical protein
VIRNCIKIIFKTDKQIGEKALDPSARSKAFARVGSNLHILNFGRVVAYTLPSFHPREQNISYAIRQEPFKTWKGGTDSQCSYRELNP